MVDTIPTSRGPLVVEAALLDALANHRIAGAAIDVFDIEPLPKDHPYRQEENLLATPHIGYVTRDEWDVQFSDIFDQINAFAEGQPTNVVNPDVLDHLM